MPVHSALTLGKSRIEALSDGVFSIAMTLLVLKLEVPEVMHHSSNEAMLHMMIELGPAFATYLVTFLIAGGFWFLHHLTFHRIRHVDGVLVWVNLLLLMFVSLLPFSAGLMNHLLIHPVSQLFYYGNQLAIALCLNIHWQYARWKKFVENSAPLEVKLLTLRTEATAAFFAACMLLSLALPVYSWLPIPVILLIELVLERLARRKAHEHQQR